MSNFTWVPLYQELADKLVAYRGKQRELVAFLDKLRSEGLKTTHVSDKDETGRRFLMTEIDPFTFFGAFNRGITFESRRKILDATRTLLGATSALADDFDGIPVLNNQNSWFVSYAEHRKDSDVARLWDVFERALLPRPWIDPPFAEAFDRALEVRGTNFNLTTGLFWIRPNEFLTLDSVTRNELNLPLPPTGLSFEYYAQAMRAVRARLDRSFVQLSSDAFKNASRGAVKPTMEAPTNYWFVGAYWDSRDPADRTNEFVREVLPTGSRARPLRHAEVFVDQSLSALRLSERDGLVVGDFGCGEAHIAKAVASKHTVLSFDHVAIDSRVIACDITRVPLNDESLDLAVFCLSLMGSNFSDYIREAHRCLRLDGMLHIWEPASYFDDLKNFCTQLGRLGFGAMEPIVEGAFARIYAVKNSKKVDAKLVLPFRGAVVQPG